jgi:hypothetical protein
MTIDIVDFPIKMVIFHSYVSLSEGNENDDLSVDLKCSDQTDEKTDISNLFLCHDSGMGSTHKLTR